MTQQSESTTTSTPTPDAGRTAPLSPFIPSSPPLAEGAGLGERRVWPRTFHDRL
ncbi:hypothetical protein JHN47_52300, partial [Streptomyces sp. MBT62]|nr:hypothetical protein [Streptomyces sp. MBT62]